MRPTKSSRGQILLITAAAIVALMLIAALVFDIGFSVMLRRQEQNAADPGALAAARFISFDGTTHAFARPAGEAAACFYARQNGFFATATTNDIGPTGCVPANDTSGATLEVNYPPDARAGQYQGFDGFVQVVISRQQETFFSKVIGKDFITVTTGAVAARQEGESNTHSMISLAPTGCSTAHIHGTGSVKIYPAPGYTGPGGYVQVNSDCGGAIGDDVCGPGSGALKVDGTSNLTAPKINVHGACQNKQPNGVLDEGAVQIGDPLSGLLPPQFNAALDGASCGTGGLALKPTGTFSQGCRASGSGRNWVPSTGAERTAICPGLAVTIDCIHLQPGVYYGGWNIGTKVRVVLDAGIYVIAGGGITIGSTGSLESVDLGGNPAPVLLFNTDNPNANCPGSGSGCQQDLDLTATGSLKVAALLATQPCPPVTLTGGCPYGGMVIWYDGEGSQDYDGRVDVAGGTTLYISGTIYAPKAFVHIEGNSGTNCGTGTETQKASVQIIAWDWDLGGTGDLCMPYDPTKLYKLNQQGLVK